MGTTSFSASNYHSVADHADFTFPNGDWAEIIILRPDTISGTYVPLSNGESYSANTRQIFQFDDSLELVVNGTDGTLVSGLSSSTWYLVCAQRSSGNMSIRFVPMGSTTVAAGSNVALSAASNSTSSTFIGRNNSATDNAFNGAISDWLFIPGETISNADLQDIATGTAIDSFTWYSSAVFWGIFENSTNTDHIGGKTITENGTLTSEADPAQLLRFGGQTIAIGQAAETDAAQLVFGNNQASQYSTGNYHSIADSSAMTLPNTDWVWIYVIRTGSDVTTGQDISANGTYQATNAYDIYISGGVIGLDISNIAPDETVSCSANTWYMVVAARESGTFDLRIIEFGQPTGSASSGTSISAAYDSSTGYFFGTGSDNNFPMLNAVIADAVFIPGVTIADSDITDIATNGFSFNDFVWYDSVEFHLVSSEARDVTGNHTVSTTGAPLTVSGPPGFIRFSTGINVSLGQAADTNTSQSFTWVKQLGMAQAFSSEVGQSFDHSRSVNLQQSSESDVSNEFIADTGTKLLSASFESDDSNPFDRLKEFSTGQGFETDVAQTTVKATIGNVVQSNESDVATLFFSNNQASQYSSGNYHSVADSPGFTLPNADWTWLYILRTPSDVATTQGISANGVYGGANVYNLYLGSNVFGLDIAGLGSGDETLPCSSSTWYVLVASRTSGVLTIRYAPFGSDVVSESSGVAISSAYDSSNGYTFGTDQVNSIPMLNGAIADAVFIPNISITDADIATVAQNLYSFTSFVWYDSAEFHLLASESRDVTSNHTVFTTGTPLTVSGPPGFTRFSSATVIPVIQANSLDVSNALSFNKLLDLLSANETDAAVEVIRIGGTVPPVGFNNEGVRIIVNDIVKNAAVSATSTASGFHINNIRNDEKFEIWRSTNLSTQQLFFTWGSPQTISGLAIIFSNLNEGSTISAEFFTSIGDSDGFAGTGTNTINFAYQPPKGFNSIGYLSFAYGGGSYYSTFFDEINVQKVVITVTSPSNPDGHMEISRVVMGKSVDFISGVDYGASVTNVDATEHNRTYTGDALVTRKGQHKVINVDLGKLTLIDRVSNSNMIRGVSNDRLIFASVLSDAANEYDKQSYQIYGVFTSQNDLTSVSHNRSSVVFNIEEF